MFGIDRGFVIEENTHGHKSSDRGRYPINKLAHLYTIRYSVLYKVHDARRPGAAENPADLLPHRGGKRARAGMAEGIE